MNNTAESRTHNISNNLCYASHCRVNLHGVHCAYNRRVNLCGVIMPRQSLQCALCIIPQSQGLKKKIYGVCIPPTTMSTSRWASLRGVNLRSVHHTADSKSKSYLWLHLKGQSWKIILRVSTSFMHTGESKFSNLVIKYLSEIETKLLGAFMGLIFFQEKKFRSKIAWQTPFKDPMKALHRYCMNLCGSVCSL